MNRRKFLASTLATTAVSVLSRSVPAQTPAVKPPVRIGVDIYSLQLQNFTPFQSLDYCSKLGVKVVHFSEIRFLGSLDPANLLKVKDYAAKLNIDLEIGMRSICPSSTMFDATQGSAEEQLGKMIEAAKIIGIEVAIGRPAVVRRCVLGEDRAERVIEPRQPRPYRGETPGASIPGGALSEVVRRQEM